MSTLRIVVLAVGKVRQAGMRAELDDYLGRIGHYATVEEVELKDAPAAELQKRVARVADKQPTPVRTIALEVDGKRVSSRGLADLLARAEQDAVGTLLFLIGGADGLPAEVSRAAHQRLSLSDLTLPHRLARLVLTEQLYRGFTILTGHPYDR